MDNKCPKLNTNLWTIVGMVAFDVSYHAKQFVFSQDVSQSLQYS